MITCVVTLQCDNSTAYVVKILPHESFLRNIKYISQKLYFYHTDIFITIRSVHIACVRLPMALKMKLLIHWVFWLNACRLCSRFCSSQSCPGALQLSVTVTLSVWNALELPGYPGLWIIITSRAQAPDCGESQCCSSGPPCSHSGVLVMYWQGGRRSCTIGPTSGFQLLPWMNSPPSCNECDECSITIQFGRLLSSWDVSPRVAWLRGPVGLRSGHCVCKQHLIVINAVLQKNKGEWGLYHSARRDICDCLDRDLHK